MGILPGRHLFWHAGTVIGALLLCSGLTAANASADSAVASATAKARPTASGEPRAAASSDVIARRPGGIGVIAESSAGVPDNGYGPADLRSAYNLVTAAKSRGRGATVAVIGGYGDPAAASDLATYRASYRLPACTVASGCFRKVNENGQASPLPPAAPDDPDWTWVSGESADVDMVSAVCPNCHILLIETANVMNADVGTAVDSAIRLGAKYVIVGYQPADSLYSPTSPASDASYFYHPGIAITVPAGDNGFNATAEEQLIDYPASSPFVTTVGGTTLNRAKNSRGWTETVWGPSSGPGTRSATSSGCSSSFGKPSWQTDAGCAGRTINDVAAVANPDTPVAFYVSAERAGGWWVGGGTTVSASIVGAVYALAGVPGAGTLPASFPSQHANDLYHVTSGTDATWGQSCTPRYLCTGGPGYNGPAGWGTPDGTAAFTTPASDTVMMVGPPEQDISVLPAAVDLPIQAVDSDGQPLTYAAADLPPGVSLDPATGVISGTETTDYSGEVTVTASDSDGATARISFAWRARNDLEISFAHRQTEPDTQVSLQVYCYEPDKSATVTFSATGLPPGLAIDPGTGVISGSTNSTIASYNVTLAATDSAGTSVTFTFTWDVWNLITVTATSNVQAPVAAPVSVPVSATDSAAGTTLTFSATDLPAGVTINPATGTISGTPTVVGYTRSVVTAADGTGSQGSTIIELVVLDVVTLGSIGAQVTGQGQAADLALPVSHHDPANPMRYIATGLPPGITLDVTTPVISGFPTTAGTYHVSITAYGLFYGGSATGKFTWTIKPAPGTGPAGPVRLGSPYYSFCLDDTRNSSATGTQIRIQACDGRAEQRWTYTAGGELRIHGKCLGIAGNPGNAGVAVKLEPCTGAPAQQWALQAASWLVSLASGLCLSDSDQGATKTGVPVVIELCGYRTNAIDIYWSQQWQLPAGPVLSGIPGKCLDVYRGQTTPGAKVDLAPCDGSKAQAWTFDPVDQTVRISGLCLTRTTAYGIEGSHLSLRECTYGSNYQWWDIGTEWNNFTSNIWVSPPPTWRARGLAAPPNLTANPAFVVMTAAAGPAATWHIW